MTLQQSIQIYFSLFLGVVLLVGALRGEKSAWGRVPTELSWASSIVLLSYATMSIASFTGSGTGSIGETVIGVGLGLVGLVITALTGMALATSWRALDDAKEASSKAMEVVQEYKSMVNELRMISVYLEAVRVAERHRELRDDDFEVAHVLAAGFSRGSIPSAVEALVRLARYDDLIPIVKRLLGQRGTDFVESCLSIDEVEIRGNWRAAISKFC